MPELTSEERAFIISLLERLQFPIAEAASMQIAAGLLAKLRQSQ